MFILWPGACVPKRDNIIIRMNEYGFDKLTVNWSVQNVMIRMKAAEKNHLHINKTSTNRIHRRHHHRHATATAVVAVVASVSAANTKYDQKGPISLRNGQSHVFQLQSLLSFLPWKRRRETSISGNGDSTYIPYVCVRAHDEMRHRIYL